MDSDTLLDTAFPPGGGRGGPGSRRDGGEKDTGGSVSGIGAQNWAAHVNTDRAVEGKKLVMLGGGWKRAMVAMEAMSAKWHVQTKLSAPTVIVVVTTTTIVVVLHGSSNQDGRTATTLGRHIGCPGFRILFIQDFKKSFNW